MSIRGRQFWKMTGSGNDFIFFDARNEKPRALESPEVIDALCARRTGIGADGVVFLESDPSHKFGMRYFNRDGSLAELCGNASLCSVTLARVLGAVPESGDFTFQSSSGALSGRVVDGVPEIDIAPVSEQRVDLDIPLAKGEKRIGFARVGVPHLVVLVDDLASVDVDSRGRQLRNWPTLADGANANFLASGKDGWAIRTYERGVEEETLACGTGAVAACALLSTWGLVPNQVSLLTKSSSSLAVSVPAASASSSSRVRPTLRGEGRLVFSGSIGDLGDLARELDRSEGGAIVWR